MAEDPSAIREAIEDTREQMAETIQALGQKADVKAQAGAKVDEVRARAAELAARADARVPSQVRPAIDAAAPKLTSGADALRRNPKGVAAVAVALFVIMAVRKRGRRPGPAI